MSDKNMQLLDKLTRNRIFNSRYWKQQCFALNAQTLIDKAIKIKYIGGLYSGAKRPTKFLCLVFKMLQINIPRQIIMEYLKVKQYKYLTAMTLFYIRLTTKGQQTYEMLQPYYNDNRKLIIKDAVGQYSIIYMDQFIDKLLREQVVMGISLPFLQKRLALEEQQLIEPRVSMLQEQVLAELGQQKQQQQQIEQQQNEDQQLHQQQKQ